MTVNTDSSIEAVGSAHTGSNRESVCFDPVRWDREA